MISFISILYRLFVTLVTGKSPQFGVRFLCYHSIVSESDKVSVDVTPTLTSRQFRGHLQSIKDLGFKVISMNDALELVTTGNAIKGKYVCISFDDGYLDNYEVAMPILNQFGYKAHFFITTKYIGKMQKIYAEDGTYIEMPYMTEKMIKDLIEQGNSIGSHTVNHYVMTKINADEIEYELDESKKILERKFNCNIASFAYPYSSYNRIIIKRLKKIKYQFAFTLELKSVRNIKCGNSFKISRVSIKSNECIETFKKKISGYYDFSYYYTVIKRRIKIMYAGLV